MTLVWRPGFQFDADASTYIEAVEAADEAASPGIGALETNTRYAINNFVIGCKQDGIWSAIKASCILAGARTLSGALVPLVGTAPTNFNFVAGDYDRETGLAGDGSSKYLNSNRNNNADPQNSKHLSCYLSVAGNLSSLIGVRDNISTSGDTILIGQATNSDAPFRVNWTDQGKGSYGTRGTVSTTGLIGASRANESTITSRVLQLNNTITNTSSAPGANLLYVFARNNIGIADVYTTARLSFYSIGESLDLALLDARVTDLMTAIGAAIP